MATAITNDPLVEYAGRLGVKASLEEVLVLTGSQQVLDLLGKIILDPGDNVVVENPTYLGSSAVA